jgi:nitroreductase
MQQRMMSEKPLSIPTTPPDGSPLKPITQILLDRRATMRFKPDEVVPDECLDAILSLGAQAPSGYNQQPWRFIVVRDEENRRRLRRAAMNQAKVSEAPIVIIAASRSKRLYTASATAPPGREGNSSFYIAPRSSPDQFGVQLNLHAGQGL